MPIKIGIPRETIRRLWGLGSRVVAAADRVNRHRARADEVADWAGLVDHFRDRADAAEADRLSAEAEAEAEAETERKRRGER